MLHEPSRRTFLKMAPGFAAFLCGCATGRQPRDFGATNDFLERSSRYGRIISVNPVCGTITSVGPEYAGKNMYALSPEEIAQINGRARAEIPALLEYVGDPENRARLVGEWTPDRESGGVWLYERGGTVMELENDAYVRNTLFLRAVFEERQRNPEVCERVAAAIEFYHSQYLGARWFTGPTIGESAEAVRAFGRGEEVKEEGLEAARIYFEMVRRCTYDSNERRHRVRNGIPFHRHPSGVGHSGWDQEMTQSHKQRAVPEIVVTQHLRGAKGMPMIELIIDGEVLELYPRYAEEGVISGGK